MLKYGKFYGLERMGNWVTVSERSKNISLFQSVVTINRADN
jgi:hypothetical protein